MENRTTENQVLEVTAIWEYEDYKKYLSFLQKRTGYAIWSMLGVICLLVAATTTVLAILMETLVLLVFPVLLVAAAVVLFVVYARLKRKGIKLERPKGWAQATTLSPVLIGCLAGAVIGTSGDVNPYPVLVFLALTVPALIIVLLRAKKNFKVTEHTCTFYESHLFFSYQAMEIIIQKCIPYTVCYAQETHDSFYLQFPAEPNAQPSATAYFDCAILDKHHLAPEQEETLRNLFARRLSEKFTQCM